MKPEEQSLSAQEESLRLSGNDPVVERLKARGLPVTRTNYLKLAYPEGAPEPLPAEELAMMEEALRQSGDSRKRVRRRRARASQQAWLKHRHSPAKPPEGSSR
jgi:hypothetical protein